MLLEPCVMVFRDEQGRTRAICMWHVDDFLVAGSPKDPIFDKEFDAIKGLYEWSNWETDIIEQCGLKLIQHADCSFTIDQSHYLADVRPMNIHKERRQRLDQPITPRENRRLQGSSVSSCGIRHRPDRRSPEICRSCSRRSTRATVMI